jgi:hypothetical protein
MTAQLTRTPDTKAPATVGRARRWLWSAALLVAMAAAAVVGVAVTAQLTHPGPDTGIVYQESNANTREDRVPAYQEPNANTREGRVPVPAAVEPNANTREGRVPTSHTGPAS